MLANYLMDTLERILIKSQRQFKMKFIRPNLRVKVENAQMIIIKDFMILKLLISLEMKQN